MNNYLLLLWNRLPSGNYRQQEIADVLQLSLKQTTRYIQKWANDGWLTYIPGRGRGNVSKLSWHQNVEAIYEEKLLQMIEAESIDVSSKFLTFDWSSDSKLRLMSKFRSKFGYVQNSNDKLIVPRKYPFLTIYPPEAADVHSANIVATVYNRLVFVGEEGIITPELAHSWDMTESMLRIYLRKDIKVHDGSILTADDVVKCLEKLRVHPQYETLWRPIEKIFSSAPLVIDLYYPSGCSYCLQMLGTIHTSIYKEVNGKIYGTGSFYIEDNTDLKTKLVAFKDFYSERALLDSIEFVQVPAEFDMVYRSASENQPTFPIESDSGFGVILLNTYRETVQSKEIRDYIHYVIQKHRTSIHTVDKRILPNASGCLIGKSTPNICDKVKRPVFTQPLVLKLVNYTENSTRWLQQILEKEGIPVEIRHVSFQDTISNNEQNVEVDLFIHGEVFEMNQNFSFFYFLRNGFSPLSEIIKRDDNLNILLEAYAKTPFEEWTSLNLKVEKTLIQQSILIPIYYAKRQIPFSVDLMNINIKHFGYVDFSKLWVKPTTSEAVN